MITSSSQSELVHWDNIKHKYKCSSILIGNGFSLNIWPRFAYPSLIEVVTDARFGRSLLDNTLHSLFERLKTSNFELVLHSLNIGITVSDALDHTPIVLLNAHKAIRQALQHAITRVHISRSHLGDEKLQNIAQELQGYRAIYTTNYDSILYWAAMQCPEWFIDYFSSSSFDINNTRIFPGKIPIHYLHGALHLYVKPNGETIKRSADEYENLRSNTPSIHKEGTRLFVAEGSHDYKLSWIRRSDYLHFVFNAFLNDSYPIVILGSSLSAGDKHIIDALKSARKDSSLAISVHSSENVSQRMAELRAIFFDMNVTFFDASTHPLGSSSLSC